jgi:hypothetical protein
VQTFSKAFRFPKDNFFFPRRRNPTVLNMASGTCNVPPDEAELPSHEEGVASASAERCRRFCAPVGGTTSLAPSLNGLTYVLDDTVFVFATAAAEVRLRFFDGNWTFGIAS